VIDSLRGSVVDGTFTSGTRLIERDLCERTGVSRTLIREALRQLEAEGLVTVIPNKGPVVSTLSSERATEIYRVRAVLEAYAAKCFAEKASPAEKERLARKLDAMAKANDRGDRRSALGHKTEFYRLLIEGAQNSVVAMLLRQLLAQVTLLRAATLSDSGRLSEVVTELDAIVAAIRSGEGEAAAAASHAHVSKAETVAMAILGREANAAATGT
jgi:DNA-binding GntR family transcriptional regulator